MPYLVLVSNHVPDPVYKWAALASVVTGKQQHVVGSFLPQCKNDADWLAMT